VEDHRKKGIEKAMLGFSQKKLDEYNPKPIKMHHRINKTPEETLVVQPLLKYMKGRGWKPKRYESKYIWSEKHDRFVNAGVKKGTSDLGFTDSFGHSCWCECKAPGRRSDFLKNQSQVDFTNGQINSNAFACVSDCIENFIETYDAWLELRLKSQIKLARLYLIYRLPKPKKTTTEDDLWSS